MGKILVPTGVKKQIQVSLGYSQPFIRKVLRGERICLKSQKDAAKIRKYALEHGGVEILETLKRWK